MNNNSKYQSALTQTFYRHVRDTFIKYDTHKPYLISHTFSSHWSHYKGSRTDQIFHCKERFYVHLCSSLVKNFTRHYSLQPIMITFLDYPFTKTHSIRGISEGHLPHTHSIIFLHPDTVEKFEQLNRNNFSILLAHEQLQLIRDIHVEPIRETLDDLATVTSYCTKHISSYSALHDPLLADECQFQIYPKPEHEKKRYGHLSPSPFKDVPRARSMNSARP